MKKAQRVIGYWENSKPFVFCLLIFIFIIRKNKQNVKSSWRKIWRLSQYISSKNTCQQILNPIHLQKWNANGNSDAP